MNKLALSLIALSTTALAAPRRAPRELFSLDGKLKTQVGGMPTSDFTLLANGRWTYVENIDGTLAKHADGWLSTADVRKIRNALASATWTFETAQLRCMAESVTYTEVSFAGKPVWTDELCSGRTLDAGSQKRLDRVMAIVNPLIASAH